MLPTAYDHSHHTYFTIRVADSPLLASSQPPALFFCFFFLQITVLLVIEILGKGRRGLKKAEGKTFGAMLPEDRS